MRISECDAMGGTFVVKGRARGADPPHNLFYSKSHCRGRISTAQQGRRQLPWFFVSATFLEASAMCPGTDLYLFSHAWLQIPVRAAIPGRDQYGSCSVTTVDGGNFRKHYANVSDPRYKVQNK